MTISSGPPGSAPDLSELAELAGLQAVTGQLAGWVAVLGAEQARRQAGTTVIRPAWKNLVFTGGPGAGKSRAARALARVYHRLGVLAEARVLEVAAADLAGATVSETGLLMGDAARRGLGGIVMITDTHAWAALPDRGQQMLRALYATLTESRELMHDDLAVILAGQPGPVGALLAASPALAARFPVTIAFPGYTAAQLAAIFAALASEAGFTLTPDAAAKAAAVLAATPAGHSPGNARRAVRLLAQTTASHARRITATQPADPATLSMICAADIPPVLHHDDPPADDQGPGQYL
jgi:hypothetical protein